MTRDGEIHKLLIHKPTFRDSGTYMLNVENDYGHESLRYEIQYEEEHIAVSGFIHHADLTKTKKWQEEQERKKKEMLVSIEKLNLYVTKLLTIYFAGLCLGNSKA